MEKDDVTTEDNIFDIEIPQDDASPDTDSLKYLANILITQAEVCNLARQVVDSIMPGLTGSANLSMVKFMPLNQEGNYLYDRIQNAGNHVPVIAMVGNDDTYEYLINIIPDYGGVPGSETEPAEMPKGASASLIRTLKEGDRKKSWQYDFSTHTWNEKSCMECTGFTEKQFDIVHGCGHPYSPHAMLIIMARDSFGSLSDDDTDMLYEKNRQILTLADKTRLFTSMSWMLDERDKIIIRPASVDARDGLAVVYRNDKFGLYTSAKTELFDCVYETEDIDKMASILDGMLNRKFERGTVAIVPLSKTAIAIMDKRGDCSFLCEGEDRPVSEKENQIFNHYLHLCAVRAQSEQ